MDASQRLRDSLQHGGLVDFVVANRPTLDETRDQYALRLDEGDHVGADAGGGSQAAGRVLDRPIDPQQATALRRDADDEDLAVDGHPVIPVRDPAGQRFGRPRPAPPARHPVQNRRTQQFDLHRCIA